MAIHQIPPSFSQHIDDHGNDNYFISSSNSNPLFSCIFTVSLLILLYFPHFFLTLFLILHPPFLCFLILLFSLLTLLGTSQQPNRASNGLTRAQTARSKPDPERSKAETLLEVDSYYKEAPIEPDPKPEEQGKSNIDHWEGEELDWASLTRPELKNFVEWDVGAPLEIIYEAYEGDEEGHEDENDAFKEKCKVSRLSKYPSLSGYYPESDADSDSGWESHSESGSWLSSWDGEFQEEGLIEIEIGIHNGDKEMKRRPLEGDEVDEEDNLIEIDVSLPRTDPSYECN